MDRNIRQEPSHVCKERCSSIAMAERSSARGVPAISGHRQGSNRLAAFDRALLGVLGDGKKRSKGYRFSRQAR